MSAKRARRGSTVPEVEAAERGDGDKNGANPIEPHGEPARGGQEQEPGLCLEAKQMRLKKKKGGKERIKNLCGKCKSSDKEKHSMKKTERTFFFLLNIAVLLLFGPEWRS